MATLIVSRFQKIISEKLRASGSICLTYILTFVALATLQNRAEAQTHQEYIIWSAPLWSGNFSPESVSSPALAQDGTVYVTAQAQDQTFQQVQEVIAFQPSPPAGGSVFVASITPGDFTDGISSSPMIADDGSVYVGNNAAALYGYSPAFTYPPLQQKWAQISPNVNGSIYATPALRNGIIYIGEDDAPEHCAGCQSLVRAFDLNGNPKWQYFLAGEQGDGDLDCSLSINAAGKVLCFGEHNNLLTALTPGTTSATKYWDATVLGDLGFFGTQSRYHFNASPAIDSDGTSYIGGELGVTAVCQNGQTLWYSAPQPVTLLRCFQSSPILGTNHSLYIGGEDGLLYALNTTNNTCAGNRVKWTFSPPDWSGLTLSPILSTPATASQGIIYVTMQNPNDNTSVLFAVRDLGTSGQELWRVQLAGAYTSSSPNIGPDGTVYVADQMNLYAIQSPTHFYNGPANTPWPMYQHDARHTGFVGTPQLSSCTPDFAVLPDIAEAWYKFSENAFNQSGHAPNGTMMGSYSWITRDPWGSTILVALNLSANLSGMTVPDSLNLNFTAGQNLTIEGWVMPQNFNTPSGVMDIVDKRIVSGGNAKGYALYLVNGKLMFQMGLSTGTPPTTYGPFGSDLRDGVWHYVAVSVNRASSSGGLAYIDGVAYTFNPVALNGDLTTTASLLVGLSADSSIDANFRGGLDEISIWRRVLNPSELYSIFHSGYVGKCNY